MILTMLNFELSGEEIQFLHAAHKEAKRTKDVNAAYKIHAVILLGSGMTCEEVAEVLFLNIDTLSNYIKKYSNYSAGLTVI